MKKAIVACLLASATFTACKQNESLTTTPLTQQHAARENDPEEAKYDDMVDIGYIGLRNLRNNEQFLEIVHSLVAQQFDEEDEVLLTTLDSACAANGINLKNEVMTALADAGRDELATDELVSQAIGGFSYYDETLYLQVYVPFIENVSLTGIPTLAANHEEGAEIAGYNPGNEEVLVDEAFAENNLTWVIGVNEIVGSNGKWIKMHGNQGKPTMIGDATIQMTHLKLTNAKEGFPNGKSELAYAMWRSGTGSCNNGGYVMADLGKYWPNGGAQQGISPDVSWLAPLSNNFLLTTPLSQKITVLFFERDRRKKFGRTDAVVLGCPNTNVDYRSKFDPYGRMVIDNPRIADPSFQYNFDWFGSMDGLNIKLEKY